ncbi:MAG: cytochrome c biogenesis protein CcdA [bacterium]|nr:cytochrome c biogenesis protein CcdA [bacterium]
MLESSFIASVFVAGVLTFLAPCTLPLVPGYLGFLSGASPHVTHDPRAFHSYRWRMVGLGVLYVLGFSLVFILIGTGVGFLGSLLRINRDIFLRIAGATIILLGLMITGVFKIPFLQTERRLRLPPSLRKPGKLSAFLFGAAFSLGWSPCVGPLLGSVLALAASGGTAIEGALLLAVFSLGLGIPFLIVAYFAGYFFTHIQKAEKWLNAISIFGGIFLVLLGMLFITNTFYAFFAIAAQAYEKIHIYDLLYRFY